MASLRELRQRQMGIKRLAKAAGVNSQTIVNIEHGRQVPRYDTMQSIARALKIDVNDIDEFRAAQDHWATWRIGQKRAPDPDATDTEPSDGDN